MSEPPAYSPMGARSAPRRPASRLVVQIIVVVALAVILAVILTLCARMTPKAAGPGGPGAPGGARGSGGGGRGGGRGGRPAITVGIAKATSGGVPIQVDGLGTVTSLATVNIIPRVTGQIDKIPYREGQLVRRGQILVQIDPRPFQIALQQAQGQLLHDEALLADARLDLKRYTTLKTQDSVSGQTYDTQAALVKQDEATVASDQANVASARLNLSFTRITAPVSGRVGLRQIDPGNQITANASTPIAVVTQIDPITVVFPLPEDNIPAIQRRGGTGLPVTAYDKAGGTVLAQGTLLTLDNVIDPTTGTVKAKAQFANPKGALFPDQFVTVTMLVDTLQNQVLVPTTATRHGPKGDFVWVLQPDRTVKSRPVTVGPGSAESVSIVSGLAVGETVITDGGDRLKDGATVVLPGQRPGGGGPGQGHGHWGGGGAGGAHHHHRPAGSESGGGGDAGGG